MKRIVLLLFCGGIVGLLYGCASTRPNGYVTARVSGVNYSEDYVLDFSILTASGEPTGIGGVQLQEFSKGALGKHECCALVPGVGQAMIVEWHIGRREDTEEKRKKFRKTIVVRGETSSGKEVVNYLIVRFFSEQKVEAELMWDSIGPNGRVSPRLDQAFYGPPVMRQLGD
jgi:hypothetical protein